MSEGDLLDFMAGLAMQALLQQHGYAQVGGYAYEGRARDLAREAYKVAEAMMAERARQLGQQR